MHITCLHNSLLGVVTTGAGTGATFAACLTGTFAAGFKAAGRSQTALGSNIALLVGVHAGETARVASLAALGGDVAHLFLGTVGEIAGIGVLGAGHDECLVSVLTKPFGY
jgi:hypothetical protein